MILNESRRRNKPSQETESTFARRERLKILQSAEWALFSQMDWPFARVLPGNLPARIDLKITKTNLPLRLENNKTPHFGNTTWCSKTWMKKKKERKLEEINYFTLGQCWIWRTCKPSNTTQHLWDLLGTVLLLKAFWFEGWLLQFWGIWIVLSAVHSSATLFGQNWVLLLDLFS